MIIDVHSHLNDEQFESDLPETVARMKEAGVSTIVVGTDLATSRRALDVAKMYGLWATIGQHPTDNAEENFDEAAYAELAKNKEVVTIGECGLDFFLDKSDEGHARQEKLFHLHLELSAKTGKPLMIHSRGAYEKISVNLATNIRLLPSTPGNVHFFTGSWVDAKRLLDLGFTISFPGVITFTSDYDEVIKNVPKDMFMVETDSPFAAPVPYRGKRNEPVYVVEIVKKIAELRGMSPEKVAELSSNTAKRVFAL